MWIVKYHEHVHVIRLISILVYMLMFSIDREFNDSGWNIAFAAFNKIIAAFNKIIADSWKFLFKELYSSFFLFVLPIT